MSLPSNYLDHLDGRLEKQGGRGSVARLLLVARKGEAADDPDAVVRYHERVREGNHSSLVLRSITINCTWELNIIRSVKMTCRICMLLQSIDDVKKICSVFSRNVRGVLLRCTGGTVVSAE